MADTSPLAGLLDRAGHVFSLAAELARAFTDEDDRQGEGLKQVDPTAWSRHQPAFNEFCNALLDLRDEMQNPPDGFAPVAEVLVEAARVAKQIRDVMQTHDGQTWQSFLDFRFHFNSIVAKGREAIRAVTKARRLDDPFAFLEQPSVSTNARLGHTEHGSEPVSVSDLLDYATQVRDSLDDDHDPHRDDVLNLVQVRKAFLCASELGLVRKAECPETFLNREGAKRTLDQLIPLLRDRIASAQRSSDAVESREKETAEPMYDPCDREPRTFAELVTWMVCWIDFRNPQRTGLRPPTIANNPDHHYLESYCKEMLGGFDLKALDKLQTRYLVQTGKTVEEIDATILREMAAYFRRHTCQTTRAEPLPANKSNDEAPIALLRVFTNGLADDRIEKATRLLSDDTLTANEKLTKIDALIPLPSTASAEQLGEMLGVTKQAVLKTDWWTQNRKGEKENEIGRRRATHQRRAKEYESSNTKDDDESR